MEEFGNREEIRLLVGDDADDGLASSCSPAAAWCLCRICHEEEEERNGSMESPCGCSGTLKFAHRECIQRWCDEKGSNVCEICLEKYEPGYTIPEKKALIDVGVTISLSSPAGSLEVPRLNYDPHNPEFVADDDAGSDRAECSPASRRRASYCRSILLLLMMILLMRNLIAVITAGADRYALAILTVFLLRASGILLPIYLMMRFVSAFQEAHRPDQLHMENTHRLGFDEEEEEEEHRIHIRF